MKLTVRLAGLAALGVAALAVTPGARAATTHPNDAATVAPSPAAGSVIDHGILSAETEAFGIRVDYDIPVPVGSGSVPRVVGSVSRHEGNDSSHGLAGAPTQFDAVVGGEYIDPGGMNGGQPQRRPPQTECFFPGQLLDTVFRFPTGTQAETAALPATSVATAQCASGPYLELHALDAGIGTAGTPSAAFAPVVTSGLATADGLARPVHGQLVSTSDAKISNVDILGAIHIGSVSANGVSSTDGKPGGAASTSTVAITGMTVGGVAVSLDNTTITVAGQSAPVDSTVGQSLVGALNNTLAATGCKMTALTHPSDYPQGFLLARQPPKIGVSADGSQAGSMVGGLLFMCDLPKTITSQLNNFSPQRVQVIVGFAYTSVKATTDPGGFGLGDLGGGGGAGPVFTPPVALGATPKVLPTPSAPPASVPLAAAVAVGSRPPAATVVPAAKPLAGVVLRIGRYKLTPSLRDFLFVACLAGWMLLTFVGVRALRGVTAG